MSGRVKSRCRSRVHDLDGADQAGQPSSLTNSPFSCGLSLGVPSVVANSMFDWIEQDYKQVKHELGWADFQVRSGRAIQRHWALVNIAFCFGWLQPDPAPPPDTRPDPTPRSPQSWPERLRRIRAYLTPLRDLQRLARAGALSLLTTQTAALVANLNQGNGIHPYLPP